MSKEAIAILDRIIEEKIKKPHSNSEWELDALYEARDEIASLPNQ